MLRRLANAVKRRYLDWKFDQWIRSYAPETSPTYFERDRSDDCETCAGAGEAYAKAYPDDPYGAIVLCPACGGSGRRSLRYLSRLDVRGAVMVDGVVFEEPRQPQDQRDEGRPEHDAQPVHALAPEPEQLARFGAQLGDARGG